MEAEVSAGAWEVTHEPGSALGCNLSAAVDRIAALVPNGLGSSSSAAADRIAVLGANGIGELLYLGSYGSDVRPMVSP